MIAITIFGGLPTGSGVPRNLFGKGNSAIVKVETFTIKGTTFEPCYLQIEKLDDDRADIKGYGMQPHLITML